MAVSRLRSCAHVVYLGLFFDNVFTLTDFTFNVFPFLFNDFCSLIRFPLDFFNFSMFFLNPSICSLASLWQCRNSLEVFRQVLRTFRRWRQVRRSLISPNGVRLSLFAASTVPQLDPSSFSDLLSFQESTGIGFIRPKTEEALPRT